MKKMAILLLTFILIAGLMVACGGNSSAETAPEATIPTPVPTTAPTTASTLPGIRNVPGNSRIIH